MNYRVVKFGGSNLKDINGIKNIIGAVRAYNQPLIIVVSAFYGITNQLIQAINDAVSGKLEITSFVNSIYNEKFLVAQELISNESYFDMFTEEFDSRISKLRALLLGVSYVNNINDAVYDEILSYGERLSSLVLSYVLASEGHACKEVLPEHIGLFTDGEHKNATVNLEVSQVVLNINLAKDTTYVIPGFYGISQDRHITLLGRGGSDYSAAAIASCLNADSLDLWKDVSGFLSADPRIVSDSVNVKSLTYDEASELAYFGSKILHPRTPEPLKEKSIPIRILDISESANGINPLTIINGKETIVENVVKSVSYSDHFGMLKLHGSGVGIKPGILAKSTAILDQGGINIKSVITSQTTINILLSEDDLVNAKTIIEDNDIHGISRIELIDNISLIAAVGEGLTQKYGVAGRIFSAVARKGINIEIICFGASSVAMYFIVNQNDRNETVKEIHNEFFKTEACCAACV